VEAASWRVCGSPSSTNEASSGAGLPLSRLGSSRRRSGIRNVGAVGSPLRHSKKFKKCRGRAAARPLPRSGSPTTPGGGGGQLAPLPLAHGAASAAGVDEDSAPEPPLLPRGRRRPPSTQPACPASTRLPGTSARRRLRTCSLPTPLVGRRRLALPIGPALILN